MSSLGLGGIFRLFVSAGQAAKIVVFSANNILAAVPSSTSGPMILTSPVSALGGQFIVASPQVMQIQDPQTGAISQVITQSPQQSFVMQQVDSNQRNTT